MKLKLIIIPLILITINSFSQVSKFTVEANYPIAIGDNFLGKNYNGLIDLGAKYRFYHNEVIDIGVSLNFGFFKNTKSGATNLNQLFDIKIFPVQPRIFIEFNIPNIEKIHPQIGVGYSILIYNSMWSEKRKLSLPADIAYNKSGFNFNIGLSYDLTDKLYFHVHYDFIKTLVENGIPDLSYNTDINIVKLGIGFKN